MALYVNTNVSSINAQRKLTNATNSLNTNYQRLASGLRINSAKDDAAGLQISDRLTAQINGLNQGNRNTNDGIALAQTIEGALDETTNMLQRIRTLAVQAANGTNTKEDRAALQQEVRQLSEEITRIADQTTFAGGLVLNGKYDANGNSKSLIPADGKLLFQVGANAGDTLSLNWESSFDMSGLGRQLSEEITRIADQTTFAGGLVLNGKYDANGNSKSLIPADGKLLFQVGANAGDTLSLNWESSFDMSGLGGLAGLTAVTDPTKIASQGYYKSGTKYLWSVTSADAATSTLKNIDSFIQAVDSKRAELGAIQNRMESTIRNQASIAENEADARSRIRDTDFASETAALTANNIIQQASQTVLAQANQRPTIALSLLGQ